MPRRRPGRVRAGAPGCRTSKATPVIDGLSARALSEIVRLERTRNYLGPGDVGTALRLWREYVHLPERRLWLDFEQGDTHWDCCGDPFEARALLDAAMRAMSPGNARELRRKVSRLDAFVDHQG
ncbi:hypothetical protein TUSST3_17250 [Streptomyces sp. TUS-ST3]|nr:hypothetical protein TUSST3_17250 [Streptomyces sp. TUS-ST3]